MDVKEIIAKSELHTDEMKYVVEEYIKEKTGKEVKIVLMLDRGIFDFNEWSLLNAAYNHAIKYYYEENKTDESKGC